MTTTAHTPPVAGTCTPAQRVTKSLLGYGVLAGVVFETSVLIQALARHGFRIAHDDASLLSNGPLGWIQVTTFLLAGAMTIVAAAGMRRAMASRWAPRLIGIYGAGLAALARAEQLGGAPGRCVVQAEIAACHARAASVKDTDWERIAALYVVLAHLTPSPVVELNRAVAVGMAYGPGKGLEIADTLTGQHALAGYAQLPAVRGDLLAKLGRLDEARAEFTRAAALTGNERERALFRARAAECGPGDAAHPGS
jgi:hypothetical protein